MKNKKILWISISIILLIILIVVAIIFLKQENSNTPIINNIQKEEPLVKEEDGKLINNSEKIKTANLEIDNGLNANNIKIIAEKNTAGTIYTTTVSMQVTNETVKEIEGKLITLSLLDKKGNEVKKVYIQIPKIIGQTTTKVEANIAENLTEVYDIKIVK